MVQRRITEDAVEACIPEGQGLGDPAHGAEPPTVLRQPLSRLGDHGGRRLGRDRRVEATLDQPTGIAGVRRPDLEQQPTGTVGRGVRQHFLLKSPHDEAMVRRRAPSLAQRNSVPLPLDIEIVHGHGAASCLSERPPTVHEKKISRKGGGDSLKRHILFG
jgi:hypothetical protein